MPTKKNISIEEYNAEFGPKKKVTAESEERYSGNLDAECIARAEQASKLAEKALVCPKLCKRLLLSMALVRTNPRTLPSCPSRGKLLTDKFHWSAYPPLVSVLRKNMKSYYMLSTSKCQTIEQQEFNNGLVQLLRKEASKHGWEFDNMGGSMTMRYSMIRRSVIVFAVSIKHIFRMQRRDLRRC